MRRLLFAISISCAGSVLPALASAQTLTGRAAALTVGGVLHAQYAASSVEAADNYFFVDRARIVVDAAFNDFFVARVQTDFAGGTATLEDAYLRLDFDDRLRVSAGQMKRAFDLFELASSTDLSVIDRAGAVPGYGACTGVGSICSYGRLTAALGYSDRDVGIRVDGVSGAVGYEATLTNGTGVGTPDENDGKSVSGRASYDLGNGIVVAGQIGIKDYVDPLDETVSAVAWGADVEVGTWRDGVHVQAALVGGDNWESLDVADQPARFVAFQTMVSYYHPLRGDKIVGVEPVGRVSVADPDDGIASDGGVLLTPGVMFYLMGKNKVGVNVDYYMPETGDAEYSIRFGTFLYF